MKKMMLFPLSLMLFAGPFNAEARADDPLVSIQVKEGLKKGAKGVKKGVKKGAHEVAEQTVELKSDLTDPEVENKTGPNGQDIFRDNNNRYYYVDGKGRKVYLAASQLKHKAPEKDDD